MQPEFHSGAVTRPLSAILQLAFLAMMGSDRRDVSTKTHMGDSYKSWLRATSTALYGPPWTTPTWSEVVRWGPVRPGNAVWEGGSASPRSGVQSTRKTIPLRLAECGPARPACSLDSAGRAAARVTDS